MRFRIFAAALAVMLVAGPAARADNSACWGFGKNDESRPDVTCRPLTQKLITSLRRASLAHVMRAMDAPGQPTAKDTLHFMGNAKGGAPTGVVDFTFQHGVVASIAADIDPATDGGKHIRYRWSRRGPNCSDFPRSRRRCE